ncbi:hypothetical protein Ancab_035587 [Ancistrocladus abbreviatus]
MVVRVGGVNCDGFDAKPVFGIYIYCISKRLAPLSMNELPLAEEILLPQPKAQEPRKSDEPEVILSEVDSEVGDEKVTEAVEPSLRRKRIAELLSKLFQAAAEGAVRVKRRKGPRR